MQTMVFLTKSGHGGAQWQLHPEKSYTFSCPEQEATGKTTYQTCWPSFILLDAVFLHRKVKRKKVSVERVACSIIANTPVVI